MNNSKTHVGGGGGEEEEWGMGDGSTMLNKSAQKSLLYSFKSFACLVCLSLFKLK